jgi:hypothetical protein
VQAPSTRPLRAALAAVAGAALGACARAPPGPPARAGHDVAFDRYTPLSRSEEIARRIMTPIGFRRASRLLAAQGKALREQPVDLARERFALYVPAGAPPPTGYGLLVFVAPWEQATEPRRWRAPLDRHGIVFVAAARSGNDASVFERRVPLALLAWENVRARVPIDPRRVYVGGLSGGSRVAEATALAFPDVFRGALLDAGSEPIGGERGMHLPAADLFARFQEARLVLVSGGQDPGAQEDDERSLASLRRWCVLDTEVLLPQRLGHEALDAAALDLALDALERREDRAEERARCNAGLRRELAARLAAVEDAAARGDRARARRLLDEVDAAYGGLAAPATLDLDGRLGAP